ncbi:MAG: trigger factor [Armatimonadetes bacterium]|nr:trigger factor [Anaerolineae bacterium]
MNIQTEHLPDHTARLTVEVDPARLEDAKNTALRKAAKLVDIPGFRKGKAPIHLVKRYVNDALLLEDAIEELGQVIYRETLDQAEVKAYGPGALEDVKFEQGLTFIYTVPLQPVTTLGDYRSLRLPYEAAAITDEMVEQALKSLQQQAGDTTPSEDPVAPGNQIMVDLHSRFITPDTDAAAEPTDAAGDDAAALEVDDAVVDDVFDLHDHDSRHAYINEHVFMITLTEGADEPVAPGFVAAITGMQVGEDRLFRLTFPTMAEDETIQETLAGKTVEFEVTVKEIAHVTLPAMDDAFASQFADRFIDPDDDVEIEDVIAPLVEIDDEAVADTILDDLDEAMEMGELSAAEAEASDADDDNAAALPVITLTMPELRERVRKWLMRQSEQEANQLYADALLDRMLEGAQIAFPPDMVEEQLDSMINALQQRLKQQGLSLEMYMNLTGKAMLGLREEYRTAAIDSLKRSLVMFEVAIQEKLTVTAQDYESHVDRTMRQLGIASAEFRKTFDNASVKENVFNRILQDKTFARIVAIGKGEAPELAADAVATEVTTDIAPEPSEAPVES